MSDCRWCREGKPEWSYDAKVWVHRRSTIDRRCENPPNDYGYTRQVPEDTVSAERLAKLEQQMREHNAGKVQSKQQDASRDKRVRGEVGL